MASSIGSNSSIGLLTSISRGGGSASSILGGQGAASLISASVDSLNQINQARQARRDGQNGFGGINASQALFGDATNGIFQSLSFASQARVQQALQTPQDNPSERADLTRRLSQLSIERLVILQNAVSENPEVEVPQELQRSLAGLSDRDLLTFRLAVRDAIDNVTARVATSGVDTNA